MFNKPLTSAHNAIFDINATIEIMCHFYKNKFNIVNHDIPINNLFNSGNIWTSHEEKQLLN